MQIVDDDSSVTGTVRMEVTGSGPMTTSSVITKGTHGEIVHGTENADGSIEPEAVTLPWQYEYEINTGQSNYYYIKAESMTRDLVVTGSVDTWHEKRLYDSTAAFTATASKGLIVYNETDDIFREIEQVDSDTDITLSGHLFAPETREYIVYSSDYVTGTADPGHRSGYLADASSTFQSLEVKAGNVVKNDETGETATITSIVYQTEVQLDEDIFTEGEEPYTIYLDSGKTTEIKTDALIDTNGSFLSSGFTKDSYVKNLVTGKVADVMRVVSESELSLDSSIITSAGERYVIHSKKSAPLYSTGYKANCVIDTTTDFARTIAVGEVIHNTYQDIYGTIVSIDADNHEICFDKEVFPPRTITYHIYRKRTLTCTIYLDDELQVSGSSTHWDEVETSLNGCFSAGSGE